MLYVAIMGYGVVGSGVAEVLSENAAIIARKAGQPITIRRILDLRSFPDSPFADRFTTRFEDIESDPAIAIVVETMGGLHPAYEFVTRCLKSGKSVVTSNKELVAAKGDELLALARDCGQNFLFEASVGGGIPILRPLDQCLAANNVTEVAGILNGTTNYMLTRMVEDGISFEDALAEAQQKGYAERDPSADIDGPDACRKICILASLAFGRHVPPDEVSTEGIARITGADVAAAAALGGVVRLIGRARKYDGGRLHILVAPMMVEKRCLLSRVDGVFNAVLVRGNAIGDVVFYGRGAGKLPTASAVVADIIDEAKHLNSRKTLFWDSALPGYVCPAGEEPYAYMLRFAPGVSAALPGAEARSTASGETVLRTPPMTPAQLDAALAAADLSPVSRLRIFPS